MHVKNFDRRVYNVRNEAHEGGLPDPRLAHHDYRQACLEPEVDESDLVVIFGSDGDLGEALANLRYFFLLQLQFPVHDEGLVPAFGEVVGDDFVAVLFHKLDKFVE